MEALLLMRLSWPLYLWPRPTQAPRQLLILLPPRFFTPLSSPPLHLLRPQHRPLLRQPQSRQ
nr:hypothetical protein I308_01676 [Cryptococcus tetragattii IND107]